METVTWTCAMPYAVTGLVCRRRPPVRVWCAGPHATWRRVLAVRLRRA